MLPTWVRSYLGAKAGQKRWLLKDLTPPGTPTPPANPRERELRGFYVVARKIVCQQCNNGWMSQLQASAKSLLSSMFNGEVVSLGPTDQHTLRRWSTMTAICNQYSSGEDVDAARREHLCRHSSPARNTEVFLAHMPEPTMDTMHSASRWRNKRNHSEVHAYFDLIAVRQLAVIVVQGVIPPWLRAPLQDAEKSLAHLVDPVHLEGIKWPPRPLGTSAVRGLFERITSDEANPTRE